MTAGRGRHQLMWRRTGARHVRWRVGGPLPGPCPRFSYDDWEAEAGEQARAAHSPGVADWSGTYSVCPGVREQARQNFDNLRVLLADCPRDRRGGIAPDDLAVDSARSDHSQFLIASRVVVGRRAAVSMAATSAEG
ncbi:hypothetical protein JBE04_05705 [Streptomyces sp. PRKS01-29]|nr:hypothetical protein [Streptomyces sabulosicollis]MBI0293996.1 hypothetical protein [Streptomyces sabulosicollis]